MKDNKLIAEFMGYDIITEAEKDKFPTVLTTKDVKYHSSWDWLMPVVLKCKESVDYCSDDNALEYHKIEDEMLSQLSIEDTYQAVVEFIKTYNKTS